LSHNDITSSIAGITKDNREDVMRQKSTNKEENPESRKYFSGFFYALFPAFLADKNNGEKSRPVGRREGFISEVSMTHPNRWWTGVPVYSYIKEPSFWDKAKPYLIGVLLATVIILVIFIGTARAEQVCTASYYTFKSCRAEGTSGVFTASGERFDENALTCAMRSRAWGRFYKVTNLDNGKSVIVRHNDFGPNKKLHEKGRIIDLSKGAFEKIADLKKGIIRVKVEEVSNG